MSNLVALRKFHEEMFQSVSGHSVTSPLGAWVLGALLAGEDLPIEQQANLATALGMSVSEAHHIASRLAHQDSPLLGAAYGIWDRNIQSPNYQQWSDSLREIATVDHDIPSKAELNDWVINKSKRILNEFPGDVTDDVIAILASVIAADITWSEPFGVVSAAGAMRSWGKRGMMISGATHPVFTGKTTDGKRYGVHLASAKAPDEKSKLSVYSIISADAEESSSDVLLAAYDIVNALTDSSASDQFQKDVFEGGIFSQKQVMAQSPDGLAYMPAWQANTEVDLSDMSFMDPFIQANAARGVHGNAVSCKQVAKAEYGPRGFKAAAVTSMIVVRSAVPQRKVQQVIEFSHPYAVIAVLETEGSVIPAFTAWVAQAVDPK